ncbi:hypothetical protein OQA88_12687 [Cercophora sp. LCS_1]
MPPYHGWLKRVWMPQETAFVREAVIYVGRTILHWTTFVLDIQLIQHVEKAAGQHVTMCEMYTDIQENGLKEKEVPYPAYAKTCRYSSYFSLGGIPMLPLIRASTFRHTPVDATSDTIRLVRLKRKSPYTDCIACELFDASLDGGLGARYEALSYTWGRFRDDARNAQVEKPVAIVVNHRNFYVTTNLYLALRRLRYVDRDRILWVDAICIDQDNDREKGHQVGMMRRIFEKSERVVVWLGEESPRTSFFMDAVAEIWAVWQHTTPTSRVKTALERLRCRPSLENGCHFEEEEEEEEEEGEGFIKTYLQEFLGRPWFTRVWVIQEVASASAGLVVCGSRSHPCDIFAPVTTFLLDQEPARNTLGLLPGVLQTRRALLEVMPGPSRASSWWSRDRTLANLLAKFQHSQASNLRDNTYALLGISSDARDPTVFPPDYTKTVDQVVRDTAAFLIFGSLDSPAVSLVNLLGPQALRLLYRRGTLPYRALEWAIGTGSVETVRVILSNKIFGLPDEAMEMFMARYVELATAGAHYDIDRGCGDPRLNGMLLSLAAKIGEEFSVRTFLKMEVCPIRTGEMGGYFGLGDGALASA